MGSTSRSKSSPKAVKDPKSGKYWCKNDRCDKLVTAKGRRYWCSQACVDDWLERNDPTRQRFLVKQRDKGICWDCWIDCDLLRKVLNATRNVGRSYSFGSLYQKVEKKLAGILGLTVEEVEALFTWHRYQQEQLAYTRGDESHRGSRGRPIRKPTRPPVWPHTEDGRPDQVDIDFAVRWDRKLRGMAKARYERLKAELTAAGFDIATRTSFWDMDHIKPVVKGGGSTGLENLRTLCQPCHKKRTRALAAQRAKERKEAKAAEKLGPTLL